MAEKVAGKGVWTDAEKLALCIAIINQAGTGTPKWATLQLPKGRTAKAAMHCWANLKKEAETIPMEDGITPTNTPKKRGPNKAKSTSDGTPTPKRKRTAKSAKTVAAKDEDDDMEKDAKKTKTDSGEDDEVGVKAEMGVDEDGYANEEDEA